MNENSLYWNKSAEAFSFFLFTSAGIASLWWCKHLDTSPTTKATLYACAKTIHTSGLENLDRQLDRTLLSFLFFSLAFRFFCFFKAENNNRNGKIWTLMLKFEKKEENPEGLAAMQYQIYSYPNLIVKHTYLQEWMKYRCLLFYTETPCRFQVTATPD